MKKFWDAHVHLFPERIFKAIWRWFAQAGWEIPFANWELEQYVAYLQKMGMERAFLLTYAHKPDISLELNRWVRETQFMEKYPHRFLYGSDFPIMEYAPQAGLQTLLTLGLSESTLNCILRENARQLLEE